MFSSRFVSHAVALTALIALPLVATARPAVAQVVFDNGTPNHLQSFFSDPNFGQFELDTFILTTATRFNTVEWFGVYAFANTTPADNFTISFFATTGGTPNSTPIAGLSFDVGSAVNRTPTGTTQAVNLREYLYQAVLPNSVLLGPGTYGISIVNDTTAAVDDDWAWSVSNGNGQHFFRTQPGSVWSQSTNGDLSFRLVNNSSAVPEPGTIGLVGMGLLPLAGIVRRRRKMA